MEYLLEHLDPERFQKLCQALLVREFPNVQCLPVAQPDGGRDAIMYYHRKEATNRFIVFQVKYVRNPQKEIDIHKWFVNMIKAEIPKVKQQIKEGAEAYYLLTNVAGTAHPSVGSIDQARATLVDMLKIPSECWWRDDLERRLDNAWDLKWAYPEILTGKDMLHYILDIGLQEHQSRRYTAIKAFVRKQFDDDREVRFKQVQLANRLFDLFIDVPILARYTNNTNNQFAMHVFKDLMQDYVDINSRILDQTGRPSFVKGEQGSLGAVAMLLHPIVQEYIPQIVLEGAPGQGKSTITQYLCQVHRMRILGENLDNIPKQHLPISVRIPFKIDLRHLAAWLSKQNPFSPDDSNAIPEHWHKSLESFLAAQVRYQSGGVDFSVIDLHEVAKFSALLLVLDGLDEVADISKRQEVVNEVITGVNRLRDSAASLQVVVTSRPAAFANSPGFPEDLFSHFELASLTKDQIEDYANRWSKARNLSARDKLDVKRILNEKLNQPHLRELARNPMQLAILLTLIHARSFLPDERTALYDSYVERYFDRETEKNVIVRENLKILIDIHQYLAWVLHSEAEQGRERGSISTEALRHLLSEYLAAEGYDTSLSEQLCASAVERIVFLVARVEGTFEFEVQPLREYFAARYLYETAPYSPPGAEKKGTMPDRFEAIARNFYWLNVTRFYAGCLSKGELPTLAEELQLLTREEHYHYISHPLSLSAMLLSDYVFAQKQKSMREVVSLILEGLRSHRIFSSQGSSRDPLILPINSGKKELIEECFSLLENHPPFDYAIELIDIINANASKEEVTSMWRNQCFRSKGLERTWWLEYGDRLNLLSELKNEDLERLFPSEHYNPQDIMIVAKSEQMAFFENSEIRCEIVMNCILEKDNIPSVEAIPIIQLLGFSLSGLLYIHILSNHSHGSSFLNIFSRLILPMHTRRGKRHLGFREIENLEDYFDLNTENEILNKCVKCINVIINEFKRDVQEWINDLTVWDKVIENLRSFLDERWIIYSLANLSGIVKSKNFDEESFDLLDPTKSLCKRVQFAKIYAKKVDWWKRQFDMASSELDLMFVSLIFLTWGSYESIINLIEIVDKNSYYLSDKWSDIIYALQRVSTSQRIQTRNVEIDTNLLFLEEASLPEKLPLRVGVAIAGRVSKDQAIGIYEKYFSDYQGSDIVVLEFCQKMILSLVKSKQKYWRHGLEIFARLYTTNTPSAFPEFLVNSSEIKSNNLPLKIAKEILSHPERYPRDLVYLAELKYREFLSSKIVPVGKIAKREQWFDD